MSDSSIPSLTFSFQFVVSNDRSDESGQQPPWNPGGHVMNQLQALFSMLAPLLKGLSTEFSPETQRLFAPSPKPDDSSHDTNTPREESYPEKSNKQSAAPAPAPAPQPAPKPAPTPSASSPAPSSPPAHSVDEAAKHTHPTFRPVLRGDEKEKDSKIKTQADFARAADEVAREYGLDPNAFRAQLEAESGAFSKGYQQAMKHEGDLDRANENNTSIGLGQISRKYLDGREWSNGGPGNSRVGSQVVTTDQYMNSPTIQLRMAASNLAQRIADHGGLKQGLAYYVSGNPDPSSGWGAKYIENINKFMNDPTVTDVGR